MKCVNIWVICTCQSIFQVTSAWCYKITAWVKDPFKVQDWSRDFNVTENKKFIHMDSDSTLQLDFKKLPLIKFWYNIKEEYG